jgi:hypothetical protein
MSLLEIASRGAVDRHHTGRSPPRNGGAQGGGGQLRGHPLIDGVADDAVAEQVLVAQE